MKRFLASLAISLIAFIPCKLLSQTYCTASNKALCEKNLITFANQDLQTKSMDDLMIHVGHAFLGTPYVGKTLEIGEKEQLVIDLEGLDCTTFLENVIVFSRLIKKDVLDFASFQQELTLIRYRDGQLGQYPSRLHYFTEWIANNESKGILEDISAQIGGEHYAKHINFMSTHRTAYQQLNSDEFLSEIKQAEKRLNSFDRYYIPKGKLESLEAGIQHGDVIAITTSIKGLDVSHTGIAYRKGNRIHLLHASTRSKKVEITDIPLSDYLARSKTQSGIMVCRLKSPV